MNEIEADLRAIFIFKLGNVMNNCIRYSIYSHSFVFR